TGAERIRPAGANPRHAAPPVAGGAARQRFASTGDKTPGHGRSVVLPDPADRTPPATAGTTAGRAGAWADHSYAVQQQPSHHSRLARPHRDNFGRWRGGPVTLAWHTVGPPGLRV